MKGEIFPGESEFISVLFSASQGLRCSTIYDTALTKMQLAPFLHLKDHKMYSDKHTSNHFKIRV